MPTSFRVRPLCTPVEEGSAEIHTREWFASVPGCGEASLKRLDQLGPGQSVTLAGMRISRSVDYAEDWDASMLEAEILMEQSRLRAALYTRNRDPVHRAFTVKTVRELRGLHVRLQEAYAREQAEEDAIRQDRYWDQSGR